MPMLKFPTRPVLAITKEQMTAANQEAQLSLNIYMAHNDQAINIQHFSEGVHLPQCALYLPHEFPPQGDYPLFA